MVDVGRHGALAREAMAYVLAGGRGSRLLELTDKRAKPAVFFGGKTRIIDFALSNALNSGIRRIAVATQYNAHSLIRDLNRTYREVPALYARDCEPGGFEWLVVDDSENSVFAWLRLSGGDDPPVAIISNFTPAPRESYSLPLPRAGRWRELINTDAEDYGGSGWGNFGGIEAQAPGSKGRPAAARVTLPPMATLMFVFEG